VGQLHSQLVQPPPVHELLVAPQRLDVLEALQVQRQHGVALQVAFARQTLKAVFSLDRL
jgi:hypothetical protein